MKKTITKLMAALALLLFVAPPLVGWGQTRTEKVTYTLDGTQTGGSNAYATESEITQGNITWMVMGNTTMNPWRIGGKNLSEVDRPLYSTSTLSDDIAKVVVTNGTATATVNSMTLIVSANSDFSNPTSTVSGTWAASSTTTFERPANTDWSNMYFKLVYNVTAGSSNQYAQFVKAEFYKLGDTSIPSIEAENVELDYDATEGAIEYYINNGVEGGELSAEVTEGEWLENLQVGETVTFNCDPNQAAASRTATVTLTYTYGDSQTVTKNVTVTQDGNPNVVNNISDITAAGNYTVQGTIVAMSTRGFVLGDGTGYVYYYYGANFSSNYTIGDKVKLAGDVSVYGGVYQYTSSATITAVETSNYEAEDPTILSGSDMDARVASTTPPQLSTYVQYVGTLTISGTYYNITGIDGATTAKGSISYPTNTDFTSLDGKVVTVTGYYVGVSSNQYYNTMIGSIEEVVSMDPSIEANDVEITYDTDADELEYTINNPVEGGILTAASQSDWLMVDDQEYTDSEGTIEFLCDTNDMASARTATVTLTYSYGDSQSTTKDVTVTQAGNPNIVDLISDITEVGTAYTVRGTVVATNSRGFIMGDGTGYVYTYLNTAPTVAVGDTITVSGTTDTYGHIIQFTNSATIAEATASNYNGTPAATVITEVPDYSQGYHISDYLQFEGLLEKSGNNYLITLGEAQIQISYPTTAQGTTMNALDGKNVHAKGYFSGINSSGKFTVMLESVEEIVVPSITVTPNVLNVNAEEHDGTLTIAYENLTITDMDDFGIQYYDAQDEEAEEPEWIAAEIAEQDPELGEGYVVSYLIEANEGEARTAYFKVWAMDDETNLVYSNLVTISQAEYVAPALDYAELPFEFNGGKADIENTDGLSQNDLGTDYNASTNSTTKLKFDGTGDWLLLHFIETPDTLQFDIKGNGFSGGTFTVQISEDGETYTDLDVYYELGGVETKTFALNSNIRYIKWIYTEKSSGNVGLGNIALSKYEEPVLVPSIALDEYTINVEATSGDGIISVVYDNFTNLDPHVQLYDADGAEVEPEYYQEWISVFIGYEDDYVHYGYEANTTTEDRTVYFKVYNGEVYSELATITQAGIVAPEPPTAGWVLTTLAELTEDDVFVIVGNNGSTYAMSNNNGTSSAPAAVEVTIENDALTQEPETTIQWTLNITENGYNFYPYGETETWLFCNNGNNGVRVGTDSNNLFVLDESGYLKNVGTERYLGIYNSQDWRCYTNTTGNIADQTIAFYKKVGDEPQPVVASITVNPDVVNVDAALHAEQLPITYENIVVENYASFGIQFYTAEDEETEMPNWLFVQATGMNEEYQVTCAIMANEGEARTAYFKVFAAGDEDFVYSNLVTINQAAYEAPAETWVLTDLADLTEGDVFVIVGTRYDDNYAGNYAMPNDNGTSAPSAVAITINGEALAEEPAANLQWNISRTGNSYTFYPNGDTENWLYCTNANNGIKVGVGSAHHFTLSDNGYLTTTETTVQRYLGIYNSQDWRCYTSEGGNIANQTFAFYKKNVSTQTYNLTINGYGQSEGGYRLIASPVYVNPENTGMITDDGTDPENYTYDFYFFDQAQEDEWRNYRQEAFNLVPGKGYLYASQESTTLTFMGIPYSGDGIIQLSFDADHTWGDENYYWNLVGNPFGETAYIDRDFYVMNEAGTEILTDACTGAVEAMQGVFVIAEEDDETLTFSSEAPEAAANVTLNLSQNRGAVIDRTIVRFGEGRQLPKFQLNTESTKLYIPQSNNDYAVVRSAAQGEMPVNFKASKNGSYTLAIDAENVEMSYLHLIDNMTGADIDLLATPSYTFDAKTSDYASRFKLVFSANANENDDENETFAFFNGSVWCISNTGEATLQVVDMLGRIVSSESVNGNATLSTDNLMSGVYMFRLVNGENVKVQKVVVK